MAETKVPKLLHKMSVTAQKAWYARNKMPLPSHLTTGSVAKASKEVKPSERVKKLQTTSLKAYGATKGTRMGGDDGSGEEIRDTVAPLTRDQHSKVQAAKRAAKAKEVLDTKEKRLAFLKKLSVKPAPTPEPEDFDDEGHSDNMDVHRQLHVRGVGSKYSMDESTMNEVTKKEAEKVLGGSVKPKAAAIGGPGQPKTPGNLARSLARRAMKGAIKKEEVEVTEAVKDAADVGEYDYEGDMAKSQLRSILANAKRLHDMLGDKDNLPEWVQSKITLAEDYILTAANYMEGEMNEEAEQVDEKINLVKAKMGDVIKDFQKSDAPQFKGKSKAKRREMAVAAKLGAEREAGMREEVEQVEEKYMGFAAVKKAVAAKGARNPAAVAAYIGRKKYGKEKFQAMAAAGKRKANEEVEQIDEVKAVKAYDKEGKLVGQYRSMDHAKQMKPGHTYKVEEEIALDEMDKSQPSSSRGAEGLALGKKADSVKTDKVKSDALKLLQKQYKKVKEEVVTEAEGKVAVTPKEKDLAAHHGDKTRITFGDVLKARLKSVAAKKMGKE